MLIDKFKIIFEMLRYRIYNLRGNNKIFEFHYKNNTWKDKDSISGAGSNLLQTETLRKELPKLIKELGCRSFLDIPCGDFYWMSQTDLGVTSYLGCDIVDELVENNKIKYGSTICDFVKLDIMSDKLPTVDLICCRDCLVHFSFADIFRALENIKRSGSTYLLTTTFTNRYENRNIVTGDWRPINLQIPPFNFPAPVKLINEGCPQEDGKWGDKSLGLWKVSDILLLPPSPWWRKTISLPQEGQSATDCAG